MENLKTVEKGPAIFPDLEMQESVMHLKSTLPNLEREARIAIRLRFWECFSIQEISEVLELPWQATDRLVEHAILELRKGFETLENKKYKAAS